MPRRQRRSLGVLLVAVLAALTTLSGAAAARESNSLDAWLPDLQASETSTGPDLIQGRLADKLGRAAPGRLTVTAWPIPEVLESLADGDSVKLIPVAKASAGPDGRFILRIDPTVPIKEFMTADGTVNFDLSGETADGERSLFSFSRRFDATLNAWVDTDRDLSTGPAKALDITLAVGQLPPIPGGSVTAPAPVLDKTHISCPAVVVATYNDRKGIVGEVYTGPHASADFTYSQSASSTLGIGVSASGSFGTFTASGTSTDTADSGLNFPTVAANGLKVMQTSWQYKKFHIRKINFADSSCVTDYYQVRETAWWASQYNYTAASAPTATNCSNMLAGGTAWKDGGTAVTFGNGVDLNAGAVGVNLSTRTGFNTNAKIFWSYASAGKLCGSNTSWPTAARVVGK